MSPVDQLVLTFVPIFIAVDAPGNLPLLLALGQEMERREWSRMVWLAVITASAVGLAFLFLGKAVLGLLGIAVAHFAVAGGLVLLALSMRDLTTGRMMETPLKEEMVAVVPLGTPLTVGPATLTTLLLLSDQFSLGIVLLSFLLNMVATWVIFREGNRIARFLGQGGLKAVSKVASLLLAAIGVRMIFRGVELLFGS